MSRSLARLRGIATLLAPFVLAPAMACADQAGPTAAPLTPTAPTRESRAVNIGPSVRVFFTRPGTDPFNGQDPEADDEVAAVINTATVSIDACLYEFNRQVIFEAVLAAITRGVTVRFAGDGDEAEDPGYEALVHEGLRISLRKPNDYIMHNKFMVVDGATVVTGSMNHSNNDVMRNNNHVTIIQSAAIAAQYAAEFEQMYGTSKFGRSKAQLPKAPVTLDGNSVNVYFSPKDNLDARLRELIASANHSVFFMIFSFTLDDMAADLEQLHDAGVQVAGIFDESQARSSFSVDKRMAKHGVPVYIDGNRNSSGFAGGKLHHKVLIIDGGTDSGPTVVTGSFNWSGGASRDNDENIIVLRGKDVTAPFIEEFCDLVKQAQIHPEYVGKPPDPCAALLVPIRIQEVLGNPDGPDTNNEFIELVNTGKAPLNLRGWKIADALQVRHVFGDVTIGAGDAVVVWSGPLASAPSRIVASTGELSLNNNAEKVILIKEDGTVVDAMDYPKAKNGVSVTRAVSGEFVLHDTLAATGSSPGTKPDGAVYVMPILPSDVFINEIQGNPSGSDTGGEFVEIVNLGAGPADLGGWKLSDAVSVRHVFGPGTTLGPGAVVVVYDTGDHTGITGALNASTGTLSFNNTGDQATLIDKLGAVVDALTYGTISEGPSLNRKVDGDRKSEFVVHSQVPAAQGASSPGKRATGAAW